MELVVFLIVVALVFDFINGFHDAANSIATIVSTRVLSPFQAVIWAAFFNFVAAFFFGTPVAKMISKGLITPEVMNADQIIIVAGVGVAGVWGRIITVLRVGTHHVPS